MKLSLASMMADNWDTSLICYLFSFVACCYLLCIFDTLFNTMLKVLCFWSHIFIFGAKNGAVGLVVEYVYCSFLF